MLNMRFKTLCTALLAGAPILLFAQATEMKLEDLSQFKSPSANWSIVGDVSSDYTKNEDLQVTKGKGILANTPSKDARGDLYSAFDHGDMDLELEFMMPKHSNSGIYLQGQYELQLFDSWGVANPTSADCGGVYERWDDNRPNGQQGFSGVPPRQAAVKAPGLWNKLKLSFEAPIFKDGKKIKNARLAYVSINDVIVQENLYLSGPTRGNAPGGEVAKGPIRIQGDHGPIAFRNIKYLLYNDSDKLKFTDVSYAYYEQSFADRFNIWDFKPKKEGKQDVVSIEVAEIPNAFAVLFKAKTEIKKEGDYTFSSNYNGALNLMIDKKDTLIKENYYNDRGEMPAKSGTIHLKPGIHEIYINYWKSYSWLSPAMGVWVSGPGIKPQPMHNLNSYPPVSRPIPQMVFAYNEPKIYRAFLTFEGKSVTHTAFVGDPTRVNYSVNPENFSFLEFWKGDFLDMGPAWDARGGKPVKPLGPINNVRNTPSLAFLDDAKTVWPDSVTKESFKFKGYYLDENGRPRFTYLYNNLTVNDKFTPVDGGKSLLREMSIEGKADTKNLYCLVAVGTSFKQQKDGSYIVGDKEYFLKLSDPNLKPMFRDANGKKEMIVPISLAAGPTKISYSLTW
jgi:hypothetical protein